MDRTHKGAVHLGEKVTLATVERYYYPLLGRNGFECQVVDQKMLRLPGSQEDEGYFLTEVYCLLVFPVHHPRSEHQGYVYSHWLSSPETLTPYYQCACV